MNSGTAKLRGWPPRAMEAADIGLVHCGYQTPYWGPCGELVPAEQGACHEHAGLTCVVCGSPATHGCRRCDDDDFGNVPLCDDCEAVNAPKVGDPHRHRQIMHRQKPRIMTEGDL